VKIDIRWQLLLVVICFGLVISLLSYQVQSAGLCTARVPSTGGRLGVGTVGRPDKINPLLQSPNPVDQELVNLIFDGLLRYDENGLPATSLAESWSVSEDGKKLSFQLRDDVRWHDGQPFSAADVLFTYELLKQEEFPAPDSLKTLWSSIVVSTTNGSTVDLHLPQPYGPILDAVTLGILPSHILKDIPVDQLADHSFNRAPVGTGPFAVSGIYGWEQTGNLRLVPNPQHWQGEIQIDTLDYHFYPDYESLGEAFQSGAIQAITGVAPRAVPQLLVLRGIRIFTSPGNLITQLLFNFDSDASALLQTAQGRVALTQGTNRPELIDKASSGQGLVIEGPYIPESWAYDGEAAPSIQFDSKAAGASLDELGWINTDGKTIREKEGVPLALRLLAADDDQSREIARVLTDQWTEIGIGTETIVVPQKDMDAALSSEAFDVALVHVQTNSDPDLYDFWSQEAIVNGQNYGGWNNRLASEYLESGRQLYAVDERFPQYARFVQTFSEELPAISLFQHVENFALSDTIQEAEVGLYQKPRDRYDSLAKWFMLYREVAVECPESES